MYYLIEFLQEKLNSKYFIFKHLSNDGLLIAYHDNYKFKAPSTKDVFIDGDFQNPEYFRNFTLDGWTVDWNNEIGLAPEYLHEYGMQLA